MTRLRILYAPDCFTDGSPSELWGQTVRESGSTFRAVKVIARRLEHLALSLLHAAGAYAMRYASAQNARLAGVYVRSGGRFQKRILRRLILDHQRIYVPIVGALNFADRRLTRLADFAFGDQDFGASAASADASLLTAHVAKILEHGDGLSGDLDDSPEDADRTGGGDAHFRSVQS